MATRNVPADFATIQDAVNASSAFDTILVASGYAGNENVNVTVEALTFNAPASVTGIVLTLAAGIIQANLAGSSPFTLIGNTSNNVLSGNNYNNVIEDGDGGSDTISSQGGNDTIYVTGGSDNVDGGNGTDILDVDYSASASEVDYTANLVVGGTGFVQFQDVEQVIVHAGSANDTLTDLTGFDVLFGGDGNDTLTGGGGTTNANSLFGEGGDDTLTDVGRGSTVDGGSGSDKAVLDRSTLTSNLTATLNAGTGSINDTGTTDLAGLELLTLTTGSGNDSYSVAGMSGAGSVFFNGGTGTDSASIDFSHSSTAVSGGYGGSGSIFDSTTHVSLFNVEHLTFIGGSAGDSMSTDTGNDTLKGNGGDDSLSGEDGNDTMFGGADNDLIDGGTGTNVLNGDAGDDTITDSGHGSTINGGTGIDKAILDRSAVTTNITVSFDSGGPFSFVDGSSTNVSNVELLTITTGTGNDSVSIAGMSAAGSTFINGSDGTDSASIDFSHSSTAVSGGYGGSGSIFDSTTHVSLFNVEHLTFIGGSAGDSMSTDTGNDTLKGNGGDDSLSGEDGNDTIFGGNNNDTIDGGTGMNVLNGDAGNDTITDSGHGGTINGGTGIDKLILDRSAVTLGMTVNFTAGAAFSVTDGSATNVSGIELLTFTGGTDNDSVSIAGMSAAGSTFVNGSDGTDSASIDFSHSSTAVSGGYGGSGSIFDSTTHVSLFNVEHLTFIGGSAGDSMSTDTGNDTLKGNGGDDSLSGEDGNDTIFGGNNNDTIDGGTGMNVLNGDAGNDTITDSGHGGTINGGTGIDKLILDRSAVTLGMTVNFTAGAAFSVTDGSSTSVSGIELLTFTGGTGDDSVSIAGMSAAGSTSVNGSDGTDSASIDFSHSSTAVSGGYGGSGSIFDSTTHVSLFNVEHLTFIGGSAGDSMSTDTGNDTLKGNGGDDSLSGEDGNDTIFGGNNNDTIDGGTGMNVLNGDAGNDTITDSGHGGTINGGTGVDKLILDRSAVTLGMTVNFTAGAAFSVTDGSATNVSGIELLTFTGGTGDDSVSIADMSAAGSTSVTGGDGTDSASIDFSHSSTAVSGGYGGSGSIFDSTTHVSLFSVEHLTFIGGSAGDSMSTDTGNDTLMGNGGNDFLDGEIGNDNLFGGNGIDNLTGGTGNDFLDGGAEADTMNGGNGNDTYVVDNAGDVVTEFAGAGTGTDTVQTTRLSYTLGDNVENLTYIGAGNFAGTGNVLGNIISGGAGNDTLEGLLGNDTLNGAGGTDTATYASSLVGIKVSLAIAGPQNTSGAGNDTLNGMENLTGSAFNDQLTGDGGNNVLLGLAGDDTLAGLDGDDTMNGGAGVDTASYAAATAGVSVSLLFDEQDTEGAGTDTLISIENLTGSAFSDFLKGGGGANKLIGGDGDDELDGDTGADRMEGGLGDDSFFVDNTGDQVVELASQGTDSVATTLNAYTLGNNVERLSFEGTGNFTGKGNTLANDLLGGDGNDTLDGGAGNDAMDGGAGNDTATYATASGGVTVDLGVAGAQNTLGSGLDTLSGIENLTGSNFADTLTGDGGVNVLKGGAGDDTLNGGGGTDTMDGGAGNDSFTVDNAGDVVIEKANQGTDTVSTSLNAYTLGNHVDNLIFTGAGNFTGTGNTLANTLTGGAGNDVLTGGKGADQLNGGGGSDTASYFNATAAVTASLANAAANVGEAAGDGYNSIENLRGSAHDDVLAGDGAANTLATGGGNDHLTGNGGNDTFLFDQALTAGNVSTVADFTVGSDLFALSLAIFTAAGAAGTLAADAFIIGAAAADAEDRIIYNSATGQLLYDSDGTGAAAAKVFANVGTGLALTENQFQLV